MTGQRKNIYYFFLVICDFLASHILHFILFFSWNSKKLTNIPILNDFWPYMISILIFSHTFKSAKNSNFTNFYMLSC